MASIKSNRGRKRPRAQAPDDEELELERLLFGGDRVKNVLGKEDVTDGSKGKDESDVSRGKSSVAEMVEQETGGRGADDSEDDELGHGSAARRHNKKTTDATAPAAWEDEDDTPMSVDVTSVSRLRKLRKTEDEKVLSGKEYEDRLRAQFERTNPSAAWAKLPEEREDAHRPRNDSDSDSDEGAEGTDDMTAVLRTTASATSRASGLPSSQLAMHRVRDANYAEPSRAVIQSVQFHPRGRLMLTAGLDKMLRFFDVDGEKNRKVHGVSFEGMPLHGAHFTAGGDEVVCVGRRPFFYTFDVGSGKSIRAPKIIGHEERSWETCVVSPSPEFPFIAFVGSHGTVVLVSTRTKQWVADLRIAGTVRAVAFSHDGSELLAGGGQGVVHRWDLRTMRQVSQHEDQGTQCITALATAPDGSSYAVGSDAGIVNVYRTQDAAAARVAQPDGVESALAPAFDVPASISPVKVLDNLTTRIHGVRYHPLGEAMTYWSHSLRDQLRVAHTGDWTTFSNWPTARTPLSYISCVDFSPEGGFAAMGNDRGRVLLYRMTHYSEA